MRRQSWLLALMLAGTALAGDKLSQARADVAKAQRKVDDARAALRQAQEELRKAQNRLADLDPPTNPHCLTPDDPACDSGG